MVTAERAAGYGAVTLTSALLVVGVVSGEIVRHVLQSIPLWPAAALGLSGSKKVVWASLPFLFWLMVVVLIWAFLAHISDIAAGTYSSVEIIMTLVIALAATAGAGASTAVYSNNKPAKFSLIGSFSALVLFLCQIAAMQLSLRPPFENDQLFLTWIMGHA